ncbi:alpha/beta fold hydrolase [Leptospira langatensis]|uniref:Alpha/beta fold hydrolase n=1 Tax=Leptospira langatensis TaxID=2484983 RepID=A0A5F1ZXE6_9LEPT|nr:alpha/beta fold hydrolase [Leptospira langatensis]TGK01290.1 alpha/beta fold hydrolase [Leptospira langatensis]TGL42257.1 alpha/beta fold hydrolase [Leptospira langatensis]
MSEHLWRTHPLAWKASGSFFEWKKKKLFYKISGEGEAILLLHGFPTSSWDWKDVWEGLSKKYKLFTFDYLGFGFSEKPKEGHYSIFEYADQAEYFLQEQGVKSVHLLAHDLGDTVAQELLARYREKLSGQRIGGPEIKSVFFLNGGIFPETHRPRAVQKLLNGPLGFLFSRLVNKTSFQKSFSEIFGPTTKPNKEELDGFWECVSNGGGKAIYHKLIRYMRERKSFRERWVGSILDSPVPFAFADGLVDPVSGKHVVERLKELRPNATVYEFQNIGHYPQTEAPDQVLKSYLNFRTIV